MKPFQIFVLNHKTGGYFKHSSLENATTAAMAIWPNAVINEMPNSEGNYHNVVVGNKLIALLEACN